MASASKRKGSGFENEIAKFLNGLYSTAEFGRTPGSGAWMGKTNSAKRAGVAKEAQITLRGDLITPVSFPFIVECKNYNDSPIYHNIIRGSDPKLDQWLKEVEFDASEAGINPMLWFKTTRKGVFVAVKANLVDLTNIPYYLKYRDYVIMGQEHFIDNKDMFWTVK